MKMVMTLMIKGSRLKNQGQMEPNGESEVDRKLQSPEQLVLEAGASGNISWSDASIGMQKFMKMAVRNMALSAMVFWHWCNACKKWLDHATIWRAKRYLNNMHKTLHTVHVVYTRMQTAMNISQIHNSDV